MDLNNPLRSIAPTVDADVLGVLAKTHASLTGLTVERLARRSHAQVNKVLGRMAEAGVVDAERVGNAVQYRLNRDHVLAPAIEMAADATLSVEDRLQTYLADKTPPPTSVVVFGSFARRDGTPDSDVDLLIIRPVNVDQDDEGWVALRAAVARHVERWTGNRCQITDLAISELERARANDDPLITSIRAEGRSIFGPAITELFGATPTRSRRKVRS